MKSKIKVCVGDNNSNFRGLLAEHINRENDMEVAYMGGDGNEISAALASAYFDVVVLDTVLPNQDGLEILRNIQSMQDKPAVIITSGCIQDSIIAELKTLGALYVIHKPFNINFLIERIRQAKRADTCVMPRESLKSDPKMKAHIASIFQTIGIPAHVLGYQYAREAILMAVYDRSTICAVTKVIYPTVAEMFTTTPFRVERAIRNAIDVAWNRGDFQIFHNLLGHTVSNMRGKPTNAEFIATVAEYISIQINL